jgi:hypothetical protein
VNKISSVLVRKKKKNQLGSVLWLYWDSIKVYRTFSTVLQMLEALNKYKLILICDGQ